MDDSLKDDDITGERVMNLKVAIRDLLLENHIHLFPYIRLARESEFGKTMERL